MSQSNRQNAAVWREYVKAFRRDARALGRSPGLIQECLDYAYRLNERGLPVIFDQEHFSNLVGIDIGYLRACSNGSGKFYRRFTIAKRSGKSRQIAEPLPTLKRVQKWICEHILEVVPPARYAKAYVSKSSIRENARFHVRQSRVVLIDIKDFFPSVQSQRVYRLFREFGYTRSVSAMLAGLATLDGSLPQGAPTSPAISNLVCRRLDHRAGAFCVKRGWRYTRYADDIAVSGEVEPAAVILAIRQMLADDQFEMNTEKTRVMRSCQRQVVTGVVVNASRHARRETRRAVRQEAYYIKKFGLSDHMAKREIRNANYVSHLRGLASHILFLDPNDRDAGDCKAVLAMVE
jgi:RNA-directed DNA polymerase